MPKYEDRILLRLQREYTDDEVIALLFEQYASTIERWQAKCKEFEDLRKTYSEKKRYAKELSKRTALLIEKNKALGKKLNEANHKIKSLREINNSRKEESNTDDVISVYIKTAKVNFEE